MTTLLKYFVESSCFFCVCDGLRYGQVGRYQRQVASFEFRLQYVAIGR